MKIKSAYVAIAIVIIAVLAVSAAAFTQPALFRQNQLASACSLDSFGYSQNGPCSDILSVASGAPGTMVTISISDYSEPPLDILGTATGYQNPSSSPVSYSIYFERAPSVPVLVASGNLTCSTSACDGDSRAATFLDLGYFTDTFAVPNLPPGAYNVTIYVTYSPPISAAYYNPNISSPGTYFETSATTTFTVT
jgi:hypothetical protein